MKCSKGKKKYGCFGGLMNNDDGLSLVKVIQETTSF